MKKIQGLADIKEHKLFILERERFSDAVKVAPDGRYWLTLEKIYQKRSNKQNRANYGVPEKIISEYIIDSYGEDVPKDYVHQLCMKRCLPKDYVEKLKNEWKEKKRILRGKNHKIIHIPFRLTTSKMNTQESAQYYLNLQNFGMDWFNVSIPDPDPNYKSKEETFKN